MASTKQLIIIYNADSTLRGKATYAFRKLTSSSGSSPACAACDITHGGLSLSETPNWTKVKTEIEAQGWQVVQWHRDEVDDTVKNWITNEGHRYPLVLSRQKDEMKLVATSGELAQCAADSKNFLSMLQTKDLVGSSTALSL